MPCSHAQFFIHLPTFNSPIFYFLIHSLPRPLSYSFPHLYPHTLLLSYTSHALLSYSFLDSSVRFHSLFRSPQLYPWCSSPFLPPTRSSTVIYFQHLLSRLVKRFCIPPLLSFISPPPLCPPTGSSSLICFHPFEYIHVSSTLLQAILSLCVSTYTDSPSLHARQVLITTPDWVVIGCLVRYCLVSCLYVCITRSVVESNFHRVSLYYFCVSLYKRVFGYVSVSLSIFVFIL